ncbi:DNA replication terminus site-binding protein [Erwinia tracheiphila]|uniref:DNA replication terminus site-binding protein n=1 Tax=Erwinia tracheiphila TaxID=65700 RepID=A0A345CQU5_9GAMM|nr:DNA replication terminus site-binding protein [Erwinia tracheiphila]
MKPSRISAAAWQEDALLSFAKEIQQCDLLAARVFELPPVKKGEDHQKVTGINVVTHQGGQALIMALAHYGRLFTQHQSETLSTKSAVRLPGAICIKAGVEQAVLIKKQVIYINNLKQKLEKIITFESGVTSEERFEFVHQQLRGLITLNAYRTITLLDNVDSVRFGWANKNIIKNVSRQAILEKLKKSIQTGRGSASWTHEQWVAKLQDEIATINSLPEKARLKIKRPVKVQPIARVWNKQQQKQTQLACPSPLLVLCADERALPKLGELLNYDAIRVVHRFRPEAETLYSVIPRMHLYSDTLG